MSRSELKFFIDTFILGQPVVNRPSNFQLLSENAKPKPQGRAPLINVTGGSDIKARVKRARFHLKKLQHHFVFNLHLHRNDEEDQENQYIRKRKGNVLKTHPCKPALRLLLGAVQQLKLLPRVETTCKFLHPKWDKKPHFNDPRANN